MTEYNFIWLDPEGGTGQTISDVLVDRCTLYQASNQGVRHHGLGRGRHRPQRDLSARPDHNHYQGNGNIPSAPGTITLPWHTLNAVPAQFQVTPVLLPGSTVQPSAPMNPTLR